MHSERVRFVDKSVSHTAHEVERARTADTSVSRTVHEIDGACASYALRNEPGDALRVL